MPAIHRFSRAFLLSAAGTMLAVAAACGPLHLGSSPKTMLIFTNESTDQATVYATTSSGAAVRIGTVFGGRTDTLTVPETVIGAGGQIDVFARLLAKSRVPRTGPFTMQSGDVMHVRLPADELSLVVLPD